jgi:tight adherence protein B
VPVDPLYLIYACAAVAGIMVAEAVYLLYAGRSDRRAAINRRMKLQEKKLSQEQVLIQLRKERGIDGRRTLFSLAGLRRLRTQSGLTKPLPQFIGITSGAAFGIALFLLWFGMSIRIAALTAPVLCLILPIMTLRFLRKRRHKHFGIQLPEAL